MQYKHLPYKIQTYPQDFKHIKHTSKFKNFYGAIKEMSNDYKNSLVTIFLLV